MRIAYIAPYQGADLVKNRPSLHNLSIAAKVKIQLIAELLQANSHEVEIISQGPVDRYETRFYPSFSETDLFHPDIPINYLSALPIRFLTGFWESRSALRFLKARHKLRPFDVIFVYNMKSAQIRCARYANQDLGLPVVLEYEDDVFVDVQGRTSGGTLANHRRNAFRKLLNSVAGVLAPSPYLLSQCPHHVPKLLVRAVVSDEILRLRHAENPKKNWVAFSGTLEGTQGLEQLVKAWRILQIPDWELHIAGQGTIKAALEKIAEGDKSIVFRGLLNRKENALMLCEAKIGMNAQDVSETLGNVFAFKIVEYLAAGAHVITTPRGPVEPELECGITYIPDNSTETIAASLKKAIQSGASADSAEQAAVRIYGPGAMAKSLNGLFRQVMEQKEKRSSPTRSAELSRVDVETKVTK